MITPLIENHFAPSHDANIRLVFFVKIRIAANIKVDTEPIMSVAKNGLGISDSPNLSTQLNFINPNSPLDNLDANGNPTLVNDSPLDEDGDPVIRDSNVLTSNDNSVAFIFDLTGGDLTFGIDFD